MGPCSWKLEIFISDSCRGKSEFDDAKCSTVSDRTSQRNINELCA